MKQKLTKEMEALLRKERIEILGAFGNKKQIVIPDKTKYNRNPKHKKKP